jgi:hypothetical protein
MRFAVGVFAVLIALAQLNLSSMMGGVAAAGHAAFQALAVAAFVICCCACLISADAISSERREGTLGLLFLTHVKGPDVLLGKLMSAGLAGLCVLLAFLPVLMIPMLSGGVTGGEALRKSVVLGNTLFVALAIGLWASARSEAWVKAVRDALLLMAVLLVVAIGEPGGVPLGSLLSPLTSFLAASDLNYRTEPGSYWGSLLVTHLGAWALLWRTGLVLRRNPAETVGKRRTGRNAQLRPGAPVVSPRRWQPLTEETEPVGWLWSRQRGLRLAVWIGVVLGTSYWLLVPMMARFLVPSFVFQAGVWPVSMVTRIAESALFAWVASRFFMEGRRTGELELLRTTPCGANALVAEQWNGLKRLFRWPVVALVLPILFQAILVLQIRQGLPIGAWQAYYAVSMALACVNVCLQVVALCWVGMWFGLRARNQAGAIAWTVSLVSVAPHLVAWVISMGGSVFARLIPSGGPVPVFAFLSSWFSSLVVLVFYLGLIARARRLLRGDLRDAEQQPLGLAQGFGELWRRARAAVRKARHWTPA